MKKAINQILTAAISKVTAAQPKPKKMRNGTLLYANTDLGDPMVSFEGTKYDFDALDRCVKLFSKVSAQNVGTRSLTAETVKELHKAVRDTISGMPINKVDTLNRVFVKDFARDYTRFISDLQELDSVLMKLY